MLKNVLFAMTLVISALSSSSLFAEEAAAPSPTTETIAAEDEFAGMTEFDKTIYLSAKENSEEASKNIKELLKSWGIDVE